MDNLLIIILARNEGGIIGSVIQAAINSSICASSYVESVEIVLVDGGSTDNTIEVASKFPITILIQKEPYKGISLGRYFGFEYARSRCGKYVVFLDGDVILPETWLSDTIGYMNKNPKVAGVSGPYKTVKINNKLERISNHAKSKLNHQVYGSPENYLYLTALYRKKILDRVGSFDPSIVGEEDTELGFRIRQANFELHKLNVHPVIHLVQKKKTQITHRLKYYRGLGQVFRMHLGTSLSKQLLKEYWFHFSIPIWIFLNVVLSFLIVYSFIPWAFWLPLILIDISAFLIIMKLEQGFLNSIRKLLRSTLESFSILIGFMLGKNNGAIPPNHSTRILKKGGVVPLSLLEKKYFRKSTKFL